MMSRTRILIASMLLLVVFDSCKKEGHDELLTIPVDINTVATLPLSEIVSEIEAVSLELTDNSLINIKKVRRVLYDDNYILIHHAAPHSVMLFDRAGKFLRQIGTRGQGNEEYVSISDIAVDFKNRQVYIASQHRLLCYDFDGNFVKDIFVSAHGMPYSLNFVEDKLFFIGRDFGGMLEEGTRFFSSSLYQVDKDFFQIDSTELKKVVNPQMAWAQHYYNDHITLCDSKIYQYEFEFNPEPSLRDTLFQLKGVERIPHLRLDFQISGVGADGKRTLFLQNIYRSSRYVFAFYGLAEKNEYFSLCYDTQTSKGYCLKDGYVDNVKHNGIAVTIRPFIQNTEKFYYLVTDTGGNTGLNEEPNPTLYIGTLKR